MISLLAIITANGISKMLTKFNPSQVFHGPCHGVILFFNLFYIHAVYIDHRVTLLGCQKKKSGPAQIWQVSWSLRQCFQEEGEAKGKGGELFLSNTIIACWQLLTHKWVPMKVKKPQFKKIFPGWFPTNFHCSGRLPDPTKQGAFT